MLLMVRTVRLGAEGPPVTMPLGAGEGEAPPYTLPGLLAPEVHAGPCWLVQVTKVFEKQSQERGPASTGTVDTTVHVWAVSQVCGVGRFS